MGEAKTPTKLAEAKRTINNFQTTGLEMRNAQAEHEASLAQTRQLFASLIGEELFVAGTVVEVRYNFDGYYTYRHEGPLVGSRLGRMRPAIMTVAPNPLKADNLLAVTEEEFVIMRPETWTDDYSQAELALAFQGLALFSTAKELAAAQQRFDRIQAVPPALS